MWTYEVAELDKLTTQGRKNLVRLLVGDTDVTDQQMQDEEIEFFLLENANDYYTAASDVATSLYAKYARLVNTELDESIRTDYSDLADNYKRLSSELKTKAVSKTSKLKIYASGLRIGTLPPVLDS